MKLPVYATKWPFPPIWLQNKASPLLANLDVLVLSGRAVIRHETIVPYEWQGAGLSFKHHFLCLYKRVILAGNIHPLVQSLMQTVLNTPDSKHTSRRTQDRQAIWLIKTQNFLCSVQEQLTVLWNLATCYDKTIKFYIQWSTRGLHCVFSLPHQSW